MTKHEDNLINVLKGALKGRDNPVDLKPVYIGKIVNLSPIKVSIFDGKVILTEDDDLYISEQFRLRCNIDKTSALSSDVLNLLEQAKQVTETHSASGSPCNMPIGLRKIIMIKGFSQEMVKKLCQIKLNHILKEMQVC